MTDTARKAPPKVETVELELSQIIPYDKNPRDNSGAIQSVAKSIEQFGFLVPIVIDANNVIIAGHTRYAAALSLGYEYAPTIKAEYLTEEQVKAFRLIDNKTAELAKWDVDLLAPEINFLRESGLDLEGFGWSEEELDCLSSIVAEDCLMVPEEGTVAPAADGVNTPVNAARGLQSGISKDPKSIRIAIGEINFFVDIEDYQNWQHEVRQRNGFDMVRVVADLAGKLGLTHRPFKERNTKTRTPTDSAVRVRTRASAAGIQSAETGPAPLDATAEIQNGTVARQRTRAAG